MSGACVVVCVGVGMRGACSGGVRGVCSGVGVWVGACGVCAGRGGEKVSLAALLSGYLGKSGHLPR